TNQPERGASGRRAFPYVLVDRVLEVEPGQRAGGVKRVSANEPYFAGHFPGAPVLPGVLLCEALVELGGRLAGDEDLRLVAVDKARFRRPVLPGDTLRLEVTCTAPGPPWRLRGVATAGPALVAEVEFAAAPPAGARVHQPGHRGRQHADPDREPLPLDGLRARGARLPGRRSGDPRQRGGSRRARRGPGLRDRGRPRGRAPVRPHRRVGPVRRGGD